MKKKMANYIIAGIAYQSDISTVISNLTIFIKNLTTGESKSGNDSEFSDLITDANGNWAINLDDLDSGFSDGDSIEISANRSGLGRDIVTTTVSGVGESGVKIVLQGDAGYYADRVIDKLGEVMDYESVTQIEDDQEFGSVASESTSSRTIKGYIRLDSDSSPLEEEGRLEEGEGMMVTRVRDVPVKGDLVRMPRTSGKKYLIIDEPRLRREGGNNTHYVVRVVYSSG